MTVSLRPYHKGLTLVTLNGETPDGSGIREGVRSYSVYGKQTLDDAADEWAPVAEGDEGNYHFFKIGVEMP